MANVTCDMSMSVDGFVAGVNQRLEEPFGDGPRGRLHRWMFEQPEANAAAIEEITAARAYIMGRNMFGPGRGAWDPAWKGWWGDDPPYHAPVFVLTSHPREPLTMQGGTTFTFVTDGFDSALAQARAAAGEADVAIAGGAATVNQYLAAGLIDELRLHVVPLILGAGERLFDGVTDVDLEVGVTGKHPLESLEWGEFEPPTQLTGASVEEQIKELKEGDGGDIIMFGSPTLVQSLTNARLVDEYRILIHRLS